MSQRKLNSLDIYEHNNKFISILLPVFTDIINMMHNNTHSGRCQVCVYMWCYSLKLPQTSEIPAWPMVKLAWQNNLSFRHHENGKLQATANWGCQNVPGWKWSVSVSHWSTCLWNGVHYTEFFSSINEEKALICNFHRSEISLNKWSFTKICLYIWSSPLYCSHKTV